MRAKRVYNNNVLMVENENGKEMILVGKGLGYRLSKGDKINIAKIEKKFEMKEITSSKFTQLIQNIPMDTLVASEEVITYIKNNIENEINDSIYITLTDHINNMIERLEQGVHFDNTILLNLKRIYKKEYDVALQTVSILEKELKMDLEDSEALFITLHIVNAEIGLEVPEIYTISKIINGIVGIVDNHFPIDKNDFNYDRFMTHCRYFVQRVVHKERINNDKQNKNDEVYELMIKLYPIQYGCVSEICTHIRTNYEFDVENDEKLFLIIHLVKLTNN